MKSVLFIHRSVGHNLIHDGNVYNLIADSGKDFAFSDYDHNVDTLTNNKGEQHKLGFVFPGGNTTPADYAEVFSGDVHDSFKPIQNMALSYDVIAIKSCYPNSNIQSDELLEAIKQYYKSIAQFFVERPDKQLVIITSPPLTPLMTKASAAQRARLLANWLMEADFGENVSVFNFFDLLAAPSGKRHSNRLRKDYRRWLPVNSHPNAKASQSIAPLFVEHLVNLS
ncbi:MAG: hypothetical protein JWO35_649 [Candidatus Saccharibacteria bacterium]|nr:hypothetical protein [Candidatus Saccharibacteria bacterium]